MIVPSIIWLVCLVGWIGALSQSPHKLSGRVFSVTMILAIVSATILAVNSL